MNNIVGKLYTNKKVKAKIRTFAGKLTDDLIHEAIIILYDTPVCKIQPAIQGGYLEGYFIRLCWNQFIGERTQFAKKYRANEVELNDNIDVPVYEEELNEDALKIATTYKDKGDWFNKEILRLYSFYGSFRKIETATGINYMACKRAYDQAVKSIKHDLETLNDK